MAAGAARKRTGIGSPDALCPWVRTRSELCELELLPAVQWEHSSHGLLQPSPPPGHCERERSGCGRGVAGVTGAPLEHGVPNLLGSISPSSSDALPAWHLYHMLGDIAEHEQDTALPTVSTASEWDGTPAGVDGRRPMAWLPGAACPAWEFSPIGTVSYPLERAGAALEHPSGRPARQWLLPERGLIEAGGPDLVGRRWSQLAARNAPVMPATMGTRDAPLKWFSPGLCPIEVARQRAASESRTRLHCPCMS